MDKEIWTVLCLTCAFESHNIKKYNFLKYTLVTIVSLRKLHTFKNRKHSFKIITRKLDVLQYCSWPDASLPTQQPWNLLKYHKKANMTPAGLCFVVSKKNLRLFASGRWNTSILPPSRRLLPCLHTSHVWLQQRSRSAKRLHILQQNGMMQLLEGFPQGRHSHIPLGFLARVFINDTST